MAIAVAAAVSANAQICETLTERTTNLKEIGRLKGVCSKESRANRLGVGFECLDRKVFDPEKVYDKIAKSGLKFARCQTGWARTETQKGKYDFSWLDSVVDNLRSRGIQPWFNVGYGNPLYMDTSPIPRASGTSPYTTAKSACKRGKTMSARSQDISKGGSTSSRSGTRATTCRSGSPKSPTPRSTQNS